MSASLEALLARIYTDRAALGRFIADPQGEARRAGAGAEEIERLARIDVVGLRLASRSFARKRGEKQ